MKQLRQLSKNLSELSDRHPEEKEVLQSMMTDLGYVQAILEQSSQSEKALKYRAGVGKPREHPKYPKTFSIEDDDVFARLQEKIDGCELPPIYCSDDIYGKISTIVQGFHETGEEFDRFILLAEIRKICPSVKLLAIVVCIRFWMSLEDPIVKKNKSTEKFLASCSEDFADVADEAWNAIFDKPLRLEGPRELKKV